MGNLQLPKKKPSIFDRVVAQVNPFDNGRTYQNQTPQNTRSVFSQATHNGATNLLGNLTVKPVVSTVNLPYHAGQLAMANITHNNLAAQHARTQLGSNFNSSIPGFVANNVKNAAIVASTVPQAIRTDYRGFQGKAPTDAEKANLNRGLTAFNQTTVGQTLSPVQDQIDKHIATAKEASAAAGYNVNASGAQKYFADPVMGAVGTYGLLKGGVATAKGGKRVVVSAKNKAADVAATKQLNTLREQAAAAEAAKPKQVPVKTVDGGSTPIPTSVIKKIAVRAVPSHEELVQRYNDHMAALSREFSQGAKQITTAGKQGRQGVISEPSVYNDVNYAAKKQAIQQQFEAGTLPKIIQVKDAPKTGKVTVTKDPAVQADAIVARAKSEGRPLTKSEQIKVGVLDEKAGRNNANPQGLKDPAVDNPPKSQVPLDLGDPLSPSAAPKAPRWYDRAWQTVNGVISQYGTAGKEIANRLTRARQVSEIAQQKILEQIPTVGKLGKEEFKQFADTLDARSKGDMTPATPLIEQAIAEWSKVAPQIRQHALDAGLKVGDQGPYYFPRVYKDLFAGDAKYTKFINNIADSLVKAAADKGETLSYDQARIQAINQADFMRQDHLHQFGNLENTRGFDMQGYEKTHEALFGYLNRAYDRISKAQQFGPNGELLNQLKNHGLKEGYNTVGDKTTFEKYLNTALGNTDKSSNWYKASSGLRTFNAWRSLGSAGISNATQLTNTAAVAGIARTAQAVAKIATSKDARAAAREAGTLLDHSINNLSASQLGVRGKITRNIASPFFQSIEKFNRATTSLVGRDLGKHLAEKGDVTTLRDKLGVTGEIGKTLTKDQELQVAQSLVEKTQFKVDPMDLPGWADSPLGKIAAQFRTFGYKQTGFMYNQVAREALNGNFKPLLRYIAVGVPAGAVSLAAKGALKGRPMSPGDNNVTKGLNALAAVGAGGLPASEVQSFASNLKYDGTTGALLAAALGPTGSFINQTGNGIDQARKGNFKPLAKEAVSSIPTVGAPIANRIPALKPTVKVTGNGVGSAAAPSTDQAQIKADSSKQLDDFRKKYEFKTDSGYGLTKLPNGKYVYNLNGTVKTADTLKKARDAIASDTLKQSGDSIKIVNDTVYRKNAQGDVTVTPKIKYDYAVGKAMLTAQKNGDDYAGWLKTAQGQIDSINKQLNDPAIDPLDALNLQNEAAAIFKDMHKYAGYGGFSSSGSASSVIGKVNAASYLKAKSFPIPSQTRAVSVPRVSVRARSRGGGSGRIKVTSKKAAR